MDREQRIIDFVHQLDFAAVTLGALIVAVLAEITQPLRSSQRPGRRWVHNGALALISFAFTHFVITAIAIRTLEIGATWPSLSLDSVVAPPLWLQVAIVFLALEWMRWAIHVLSHKMPILWRLHAIHHADPEMDASTAFRHHPLEALISVIPVTLLTLMLGASVEVLMLYRLADLSVAVFSHVNVNIPRPLEYALGWVLVTPRFHRTHHLSDRTYTDSNYGAITPWFDYLFGTYRAVAEEQNRSAAIGLNWCDQEATRLDKLLLAPFSKPKTKNA